jgi:hypothetical protein
MPSGYNDTAHSSDIRVAMRFPAACRPKPKRPIAKGAFPHMTALKPSFMVFCGLAESQR